MPTEDEDISTHISQLQTNIQQRTYNREHTTETRGQEEFDQQYDTMEYMSRLFIYNAERMND